MSSQNCTPSFNLAADIAASMAAAAAAAGVDPSGFEPGVRTAEPRHGDYQANGVLACARETRTNPRELAGRIVAGLPPQFRAGWDVAVAGRGFINFPPRP